MGTGFHPELTGRENIFLNGSLLGMRATEIRDRFDEIVSFSEIEEFIDTPVKRYSSGMYVRLAFAVAAHLEPEILIVDEVLAVGDVAFQKKCLGKMSDVARGGRTVLFVSHNMAAVRKLCSRGVLLEGGKLTYNGPADTAVESYLDEGEFGEGNGPVHIRQNLSAAHQAGFAIESIALLSKNGEVPRDLKTGDSILLRIQYVAERRFMGAEFIVSCKSEWGEEIFRTTTSYGTPAIHWIKWKVRAPWGAGSQRPATAWRKLLPRPRPGTRRHFLPLRTGACHPPGVHADRCLRIGPGRELSKRFPGGIARLAAPAMKIASTRRWQCYPRRGLRLRPCP